MTFISLGLGSWLNEDAEKFRSMTFNDSEVGSISFFSQYFASIPSGRVSQKVLLRGSGSLRRASELMPAELVCLSC